MDSTLRRLKDLLPRRMKLALVLIVFGVILFKYRPSSEFAALYTLFPLFGSTLVIAGATLLLLSSVESYISDQIQSSLQIQQRYLAHEIEALLKSFSSMSSSGIANIYWSHGETTAILPKLLSESRSQFDILGVSLFSVFREPHFQDAISNAIYRGVRFRILLLDPESSLLNYYATQEGSSEDFLRLEIKRSVEILQRLSWMNEQHNTNLELRLLQTFTPLSMIAGDDAAVFQLLLHSTSSHSIPQIHIYRGGLYRYLSQSFDDLWYNSPPSKPPSY